MTTPLTRAEPHRVLVVLDDACTAPALCKKIRVAFGDDPVEALVLAPAHETGTTRWYVDEDAARADAMHRLRTCAACLARDGVHARVRIADPDPVQAVADALHEFAADRVLLVATAQRPSTWLRPTVVERMHRAFDLPVDEVVSSRSPHAVPTAFA